MGDETVEPLLRVVVIDDEPALRTLVRVQLERSGRATVVAESDGSPDTVLSACAASPDIVLLDQNLDGVRGTDLIGGIARTAPNAMVVMLTALDASTEEAAALSAGAFVFYEKRVMAASIVELLEADFRLFSSALNGREVFAPSARSRRHEGMV